MSRIIFLLCLFEIAFGIRYGDQINARIRKLASRNDISPYAATDYHVHEKGVDVKITGININGFSSLRPLGDRYARTRKAFDNTIWGGVGVGELKATATVEVKGGTQPFKQEVVATTNEVKAVVNFGEGNHPNRPYRGLHFIELTGIRAGSIAIPGIDEEHVLTAFRVIFAKSTKEVFDKLKEYQKPYP